MENIYTSKISTRGRGMRRINHSSVYLYATVVCNRSCRCVSFSEHINNKRLFSITFEMQSITKFSYRLTVKVIPTLT